MKTVFCSSQDELQIKYAADPSLTLRETFPLQTLGHMFSISASWTKAVWGERELLKTRMLEGLLRGKKNLTLKKSEAVNNRRRHNENAFLADLLNTVKQSLKAELHPWWNTTNLPEQRARQNPQYPCKIFSPWVIITFRISYCYVDMLLLQ